MKLEEWLTLVEKRPYVNTMVVALRMIRAALKAHHDDEDHMPYMQAVLDEEEKHGNP